MKDCMLLLVGHGSRHRDGNRETLEFAAQWQARHPDWHIETCFIEHAAPLLDAGLDAAARAAGRVVVVPFVLNAAGHVKMELPAAVEAARKRHPETVFAVLRHLGLGRDLFAVLQRQLEALLRQLDMPDPRTTGVILLGRGSSDAGANGELAKMTRWLFEAGDFDLVDLAFTGVTWPRLESVVQRQARLGMTQIAIVPAYLFNGVLMLRIAALVERLRRQYPGIVFALGKPFGFDPGVMDLLERRLDENGEVRHGLLECDGCKYRAAAASEHRHDHGHTAACQHAGHTHPRNGSTS